MRGQHSAQPARLLVVDDEAAVRKTVRRTLEASGYEVIEAANGLDALAALKTDVRVDLVVADLAMPELSGADMVCRIRGSRPDIKILYVTGFIDSLMDARTLWEGEAFLEKPFTLIGLREAVSLLLYGSLTPLERDNAFTRICSVFKSSLLTPRLD
jgi:two-component system cell cycle sensor histidine kinase/response regulator CckA